MTASTIHPIVLEKLLRFSRQRRRLILWRGLCGTLAVWFATMIAIALADRFILMPDGVRWTLTIIGDLVTLAVFWFECGRYLIHQPTPRELARLVELAAPQLREELLSAVELSEGELQPHWDSAEFRAALQQAAARDVGNLQMDGLLNRSLIAKWIYAALGAAAVLGILFVVPGLRFNQSFARAVLPASNLARFSSINITLVAPVPADQIVPEGDSVPVTVKISGGDVQQVILETDPKNGPGERTPMVLSAVNEFTGAVQLNQQPVEFRIRAQDAITRRYTLTPKPRPHVVRFEKTYHYPTYSQLPAKTVTEENGDLDALEGTEVQLNLDVDQPIQSGALQFDAVAGKTNKTEIALERVNAGRLTARVPLTAAGIYQVHLVGAQTGFENKFSPQYEIRLHPDLIPAVKIILPEKDQLVLAPDSVVNLTGLAKDDLLLSNVVQSFQVNRGPWRDFPLVQTNSSEVKVSRTWDLFDLGLHPGDRVLTKLVATDLKGQRGESAPLRIRIGTEGFDPERLKDLKERQSLDKTIHEFREAADQLDIKTREARTVLNTPTADPLQKKQAVLAAITAAETTERKADEALQRVKEVLPHAATSRESADLALIGTAISRAKSDGIQPNRAALEHAAERTNAGDDKAAKADLDKVLEPLATSTALARSADDAHHQLLGATEANAAVRDLQQLATEQTALNEQLKAAATDSNLVERVAHRESIAIDRSKAIEEQMKTLAEHTYGNPAAIALSNAKAMAQQREALEKVLSTNTTAATLKAPSEQLQRMVENSANALRAVERELTQRAENTRKGLQDQTGTAADTVARLLLPTARPENWQSVADQLKERAALQERRPHPDSQFVATIGKTAEAIQSLQDTATTSNAVVAAKAIESALRKVQTGHAIEEQVASLRELAARELWDKPITPAEAATRANDWKWTQQQLQAVPAQLDRSQLPADVKKAVEAAARSEAAQQITAEMNQRQTALTGNDVSTPLTKMADDIAQVKQQMQPALQQAREELEKRAPTISDRMDGLAHVAEQIKSNTVAQVQLATHAENTNQVKAAAQAMVADQQRLDSRIEEIKNSLRREANAQGLSSEESRARARDADDAAALLRQTTPTAKDFLQHAAATEKPEQLRSDLRGASDQQSKLADDLKLLAKHYRNAEAGHPEATRAELREAEKIMGLKPTLDAEYAKAEALERLASLAPQQQLAELEKTLPNSQSMRRELSDIAKEALTSASTDLQQSAERELQIAREIGTPADQARRLAETAEKLAQQTIPAVVQKAGPAGEIAKPDFTDASQQLTEAAKSFKQSPEQSQAAPLQQAAKDLTTAANKLSEASQTAQAQATAAAQALQQARTDKAAPAALKQAETAQQQAQAAAQQMQAAQQQAQQAAQQAAQLAQQADQLAEAAAKEKVVAQARQIAEDARQLAQQDIPALAKQTGGESVQPELNRATEHLESTANNLPPAFVKPPEQMARDLQQEVAPLRQAAAELKQAAEKLDGPAKTAAEQSAQKASQLAQQAGEVAAALNPSSPPVPAEVVAQAKQVAAEVQKLAQESIPALSAKAGDVAKPEIADAGRKLESVNQNTPQDFSKPPEQLAQAMQQQVAPLQQAAADLQQAAAKLEGPAKAAAEQSAQKADQLARQAGAVATALNPVNPAVPAEAVAQAKQVAAEAQKLAQESVPALAAKAGDVAKPEITSAEQKLESVSRNAPQDFSKPPEQLSQAMQQQVAPLQQAAAELKQAAEKLDGPAKTAAEQSAQKAGQLAQQASEVAAALNPEKSAIPPEVTAQAKQVAAEAQKLAQETIPTLAAKAADVAKSDLADAGQKLDSVGKNAPQDFTKPPEQLAQAMQQQIAPLQQAAADLKQAAEKLDGPARDAAVQAAQKADQLALQAGVAAAALNPNQPAIPPEVVAEAKQVAAEAQKLAKENLPALAAKAGDTGKPELADAVQKLESAAKNAPQDFVKPPEQIAQALQNQAVPLELAATALQTVADKLGESVKKAAAEVQQAKASNAGDAAVKQAEAKQQTAQTAQQQASQAAQQAEKLALRADQAAAVLNPVAALAKQVAEEVKKLAEQSLPVVREKAGETAKPELTSASQKLDSIGKDVPSDFAKSPEQVAQSMQNQVAPLQQAAADLQSAADKLAAAAKAAGEQVKQAKATNAGEPTVKQAEAKQQQAQAAQQAAQQASQKAGQLAQQAAQAAKSAQAAQAAQTAKAAADTAQPAAPAPATPQAAVAQAKQIAEAAQKLAEKNIPAMAEQSGPAGAAAKPDLNSAAQKLAAVSKNVPQDLSKPPEQLVQAMQNQVAPLQQASKELNNAAAKLGQAATTAQQQADRSAQAVQQAKATNAPEAAIQKAEAAQQQSQAAAQQAQAAQLQARQAAQQADRLAQQAAQAAEVFNQAKTQVKASAQQPEIEQSVRDAGADIQRAGRHEARLGQAESGQQLQRLGQQIEKQTASQLARAADTMAQAKSAAQVQPAAQAAHDAIQNPLGKLNSTLKESSPSAANAAAATDATDQLASAPEESAKWMARALDSLDEALHQEANSAQPASPNAAGDNNQPASPEQSQPGQSPAQPGQPGSPNQGSPSASSQAAQAAQKAAAQAAAAAARAQSAAMMAARSQGLAPGEQSLAQGESSPGGGGGIPQAGKEFVPVAEGNKSNLDWGKLPPKLARDLIDSQREGVNGEYREMVDMYFRAIADKTREKQP